MNNVYLIGMMGSGKSTIGRLLSEQMDYAFIDADEYLIKHSDFETIHDIFKIKGEAYFRGLEKNTIKSLSQMNQKIIATGGGVILDPDNIRRIQNTGMVIYLDVPIDLLVSRLSDDNKRPLLKNTDLHMKLENLFHERKHLYQQAAKHVIHVDDESPKEISDRIYYLLKEKI